MQEPGSGGAILKKFVATENRATAREAQQRGDRATALAYLEAALASDPGSTNAMLELAETYRKLGRLAEARQLCERVLAGSDGHDRARSVLAEVALMEHRREQANALLRFDWRAELVGAFATLRSSEASDEQLLQACEIVLDYGFVDVTEPALAALVGQSTKARGLRGQQRRLRQLGLAGGARPEPRSIDDISGCIDHRVAGADTLILVFGGMRHRFFVNFDLLHNALRTTGASVIYLRDLERVFYFNGIVGIGEGVEAAVAGLKRMIAESGARRVLAMGTCMGCAGALRYGLEVGAEAVLALAPRSRVPDADQFIGRTGMHVSSLRQMSPHFSQDPRVLYAAAAQHPRITAIFSERIPDDAEDVADLAAIPGTTVAAIPAGEHDAVSLLLTAGLLTPVLHQFVEHGVLASDLVERIRMLGRWQPGPA